MSDAHYVRKSYDPNGTASPVWHVYRPLPNGQRLVVAAWTTEAKAIAHAAELSTERLEA